MRETGGDLRRHAGTCGVARRSRPSSPRWERHGLGGQGTAPVGRVELLAVEAVDGFGAEPSEPDLSDGGQDVQHGVAFVTVVRAGGEFELLGREPLGGQVGAEAERPGRIGAAVDVGGESCGQLLGFEAVGAGGVP